jgi:acetyl esterase/lipase
MAYGNASEVLTLYSQQPLSITFAGTIVLWIHGGMWQALSMADSGFPAKPVVEAGHVLAALEYTIAPEGVDDYWVMVLEASHSWCR